MPIPRRTINRGLLVEAQESAKREKVRADAIARNIVYHFDPLDTNRDYIDRVDLEVLDIFLGDLKVAITEYKKQLARVESLKSDMGVEA